MPEKNSNVLITTHVFKNWLLQFSNKFSELNIQRTVIMIDASCLSVIVHMTKNFKMKVNRLMWLSGNNILCDPNQT